MVKIPEEYFIVSEVDCPTASTLQQAKKLAREHFDQLETLEEAKIYKLIDVVERVIRFKSEEK